MELNDFVQIIAEQFDETPLELFTAETVFKNQQGWSSLTALSIMAVLDEELEIRITGADLRNCNTIEELYHLAISK